MTWWVALIVAVCAGVVMSASLLALGPVARSEEEANVMTGHTIIAGIALAIGLYVVLVQA